MKLMLMFLFAAPAHCRQVVFDKAVNVDSLEKNLRAAGFAVDSTACAGTRCTIIFPDTETKDPVPVIMAEPAPKDARAAITKLRSEAAALAPKLDDGTITDAEKNRLLKVLLLLLEIVGG